MTSSLRANGVNVHIDEPHPNLRNVLEETKRKLSGKLPSNVRL